MIQSHGGSDNEGDLAQALRLPSDDSEEQAAQLPP